MPSVAARSSRPSSGTPSISRLAAVVAVASVLVLPACATRRLELPTGAGTPLADFNDVHQQLARECRQVRTLTAELSLTGRAGGERIRGRVVAGFEAPASMRLEGVAPFGPPGFILVAGGSAPDSGSVLVLPRDARVLRGATAEDVLGAITGLALGPADLQAILTGCVQSDARPLSGRAYDGGWASIELEGGASLYLRMVANAWQVRAARLRGWQIEYAAWQGAFPRSVTLRAVMPVPVDLTAAVSQLETNVPIAPEAFTVDAANASPLSLEELRAAGPLRQP
jgi:hypothetical protein